MRPASKKLIGVLALSVLGLVIVAQIVPYGRDHTNPATVAEPAWDRPSTRDLAERACFDCHSNETRWPWYSHVAPMSWLVQHDVDEGRNAVNFSRWDLAFEEASESGEVVRNGEMPPRSYLWLHPAARLTKTEKQELARGLDASMGSKRADASRDDGE